VRISQIRLRVWGIKFRVYNYNAFHLKVDMLGNPEIPEDDSMHDGHRSGVAHLEVERSSGEPYDSRHGWFLKTFKETGIVRESQIDASKNVS
jgi:hypothetical protein